MLLFSILKDIIVSVIAGFISKFFGLDELAIKLRQKTSKDNLRKYKLKHKKGVTIFICIMGAILGALGGAALGIAIGIFIIVLSLGGILFNFEAIVNIVANTFLVVGAMAGILSGLMSSLDEDET